MRTNEQCVPRVRKAEMALTTALKESNNNNNNNKSDKVI